jgi:hypothetical protein
MFTQARAVSWLGASVIAAAALSLAASAAWAGTARASKATAITACTSADLGVWVAANQQEGAAGTLYMPLEFTNLSKQTCTLYGYPGVSAISASGTQLGNPASRDTSVASPKPTTVTLAAGGTAYAQLRYSNVYTSDCKPTTDKITAFELKVYAPNQTNADDAYFDLATCTAAGQDNFLLVGAIAPGPGVIGSMHQG